MEAIMSETTRIPYKIYLEESEMPRSWYNVRADMKNKPAPLLNPGTLQPITFDELKGIFCEELSRQELDENTAYIEIPEEIRNFYKMYRPSPLVRAYCLEEKRQKPVKKRRLWQTAGTLRQGRPPSIPVRAAGQRLRPIRRRRRPFAITAIIRSFYLGGFAGSICRTAWYRFPLTGRGPRGCSVNG